MTMTGDIRPDRLPVIDALRAIALFGVITMNITGMVMALIGGQVMGTAGIPDYVVGTFDLVFVQGKARSTFAFLFGVGFGLLMSRTGPGFVGFYLRRMAVLLAIGVVNLLAFYWGDILILYAVLGMVLMLFRGVSDRTLLRLGLVLIIAPPLIAGLIQAVSAGPLTGLNGQTAEEGWAAFSATAPVYQSGGFFDIARLNLGYYLHHPLFDTAYVAVYDIGVLGLFMLGLWTARKGVFANVERHRPFLRRVMWTCLPLGLVISLGYAVPTLGQLDLTGWAAGLARAAYVGLPMAAFGYVAAFTLWLPKGGRWLQRALTPMGRMALTGYLASNLIGSLIWYGGGLGLMGQVGFAGMAGIALAVFLCLCVFSHFWLKRFSVGPIEGIWRRLSGRRHRAEGQAASS